MKDFLIIANETKEGAKDLALSMSEYIEKKGGTASLSVNREGKTVNNAQGVFSIGGDGTIIRAARNTENMGLPLIGINMGTLGYLCELEENNVYSAIDEIMAGKFMIDSRMRLSGRASKKDEMLEAMSALNDVVIRSSGDLSVVKLYVHVNGKLLMRLVGDGVIISTPTGSTGYNLSAGGPIVDPVARVMLITPINTHNLYSRSIVINADDEVVIEMRERNGVPGEHSVVSIDGERYCELLAGEKITIRQSVKDCRFIKLKDQSFLDILRRKMRPLDN